MMTSSPAPRRSPWSVILLLAAIGLLALYFWPRQATAPAAGTATAPGAQGAASGQAASTDYGPLPPGAVSNVGGIPLDAQGHRVLNAAGLPISNEPLPQARPIPVRAPPGAVIGYTTDAQGVSHPLRAGDLKQVPNSPGTYAVVDMWAEGGPAVVPATEGHHLTPAEVAKLRAAEDARDRASAGQH